MQLKGSKTEKNLLTAFAGEAQARNRYSFFASHEKKKILNKYLPSLSKLQTMKKNMPKDFLSFLKEEMLKLLPVSPQA